MKDKINNKISVDYKDGKLVIQEVCYVGNDRGIKVRHFIKQKTLLREMGYVVEVKFDGVVVGVVRKMLTKGVKNDK